MVAIKISRNGKVQVQVLLLGLLSLFQEAVVVGLDFLDLLKQLDGIDGCFVGGFAFFAAELPRRECIYWRVYFFEAAPAIDMTWIFLFPCVGCLHLYQYAFRALFLQKFSVHLEGTLTDGLLWIGLVNLVILLHFIDDLAPMHELLLFFWFRRLSFETALSLLYAYDLQYRKHHFLLFFFKQLWSSLLFFLIFSIDRHINLFSLAIFYDFFNVQLPILTLLSAFERIFEDIQRRVEHLLIFLNIFLEFDTISNRYVLPFVNLFLCCIDQLLQLIDILISQLCLDVLHFHICQCHLQLFILFLYIISRIHFLSRSVLPQKRAHWLHGLVHFLLLLLHLDLFSQ